MDKLSLNVGDPVMVETVPGGKFMNNKNRRVMLQHGIIVQLCGKFAAVNMGKFVESFDYDRIQKC